MILRSFLFGDRLGCLVFFFFSSRRRHTRWTGDWSSDVCSSDLTPDAPARLSLYGHGLLGSDREVFTNPDIPEMAQEHDFVFCATPWEGMSSPDIPNAGSVLQDLSGMPTKIGRASWGKRGDLGGG